MPPHPLDLRHISPPPNQPLMIRCYAISDTCDERRIPPQAQLLHRSPAERLAPVLPAHVLVVDALSYHLSNLLRVPTPDQQTGHAAKQRERDIEDLLAWFSKQDSWTRQRFVIGFELQLDIGFGTLSVNQLNYEDESGKPPYEPPSARALSPEIALRYRQTIISCDDVIPVMPSLHRISDAAVLFTPEITHALRRSGWRDAAGRDIDSSLLGAAFNKKAVGTQEDGDWRLPPGWAHNPDPELALSIDTQFKITPYTLFGLLSRRGIVLTAAHREALQRLAEDPDAEGRQIKQALLVEYLNAAEVPKTLRACLDLDRANRAMAQLELPAEQVNAPAEHNAAFTL